MSGYSISFARSARRELERLPERTAIRILSKIETLAVDPRPRGCKKIQGSTSLWRIRIGDYRVIYEVDDDAAVVDVNIVRHRTEAYR